MRSVCVLEGGRCAPRLGGVRCMCLPARGCAGEVRVCPQPWVTRVWGVPVAEPSLLPDLPTGHRCCPQTDGWRPPQPRPAPRPTVDCQRQPCRGPAEDGASPGRCRSRPLSDLDPPSFRARLPFASAAVMNGLSISQLCCLFCCPPCPSRIAAKLAFLPPEPTYAVVPEPEPVGSTSTGSLRGGAAGRWKLHLKDRADFQYSQRELDNIEVFVTKSSRGNRVGCMYVRCVPGAR